MCETSLGNVPPSSTLDHDMPTVKWIAPLLSCRHKLAASSGSGVLFCFALYSWVLNHIRGSYNASTSQTAWSCCGHSSRGFVSDELQPSEIWIRWHCSCNIHFFIYRAADIFSKKIQKSGIHRRALSSGKNNSSYIFTMMLSFFMCFVKAALWGPTHFCFLCYNDGKYFKR